MQTAEHDFDVLIAGGGMVGASLALALEQLSFRIGLIEAVRPGTAAQPSYDDRSTAIAWASRRIFEALDVWPKISEATAIREIHVSDRGFPGISRINAEEFAVEALGYVVPNRALGAAFSKRLAASKNISLICPARVTGIHTGESGVQAKIEESAESDTATRTLSARLLVAADGARSTIRSMLNISATDWDYGQTAVIANVTPERQHDNIAYERFTDSGPLALLPLSDNRCSLVWSVPRQDAEDVLQLDDEIFLMRLRERFGARLGNMLKTGRRNAYPLSLVRATRQVGQRVVIAGNAAHSLHPIAGQGFNLSLRDVAMLAEALAHAALTGTDPGADEVLRRYVQQRRRDQFYTMAFTDGLTRIFSNPLRSIGLLRSTGLLALSCMPGIKRSLVRHSMGLGGKVPRLALGQPLL